MISTVRYDDTLLNGVLSASRLVAIFIGVFVCAPELFSFEYAKKMLNRMAIMISFSIFVQILIYYLFGKATFFIIPALTLNYGHEIIGAELIDSLSRSVAGGYIYRPMSVFLEPAYCGYYLVPAIVLILFSENYITRRSLRNALLITVATVLTTSMVGIVSVIVVWIAFMLYVRNLSTKIKKYACVFVFIAIIVMIFVFSQEAVQFAIMRKFTQLGNFNSSSSTSMRLFRGLDYFKNMNLEDWLFGVGFGHLDDYYFKYGLASKMSYVISEVAYMNSLSSILCSSGFSGLSLYLFAIISYYRTSDNTTKWLVTLLIMFLCAGAVMDIPVYYLILALILSQKGGNNNSKEETVL